MTDFIQPTDDQILGYLRGCPVGSTITVSDMVLGFGGTPQQHTAQLQALVKAGSLECDRGQYGLSMHARVSC